MSDRGKFSGFAWHVAYHTTDKKKDKAADCIYLNKDRICQCKSSPEYQSSCFVASVCKYRVKSSGEALHTVTQKSTPKANYNLDCSLPIDTIVQSTTFGAGRITGYEKEHKKLMVSFVSGKKMGFIYPEAFLDKHLLISDEMFDVILNDIAKSKKE